MRIPNDLKEQREKYEKQGLGTCGPSILALLFNHPVEYIINHWYEDEYKDKGYANLTEMRRELNCFTPNWVKIKRGNKSKELKLPEGYWMAIARIQWEGDWGHWIEAQKHTHYVLIQAWGGENRIFCNSIGWFNQSQNKNYLKKGHITSFLVIDNWKMVKPQDL